MTNSVECLTKALIKETHIYRVLSTYSQARRVDRASAALNDARREVGLPFPVVLTEKGPQ